MQEEQITEALNLLAMEIKDGTRSIENGLIQIAKAMNVANDLRLEEFREKTNKVKYLQNK